MANFLTKAQAVEAIQFTGVESLSALQAFLAPASPLYDGEGKKVLVATIDRNAMKEWPSLGRQFSQTSLHVGSWVIREPDGFAVLTDDEMRLRFDMPEPEPAMVPEDSSL